VVVVDELDELELELGELEPDDAEVVADEVLADPVEPAPGDPASHAAVAARASVASPVRTMRAWRRGCSVTARTYPAGPPRTKPPP
jgi:hypothetical protein